MAHFGLVESFGVDDGQLDGIPSHECFVLGYEYCQITCHGLQWFAKSRGNLIHVANRERLQAAAEARGLRAWFTYPHDDKSEGWCEMHWEPKRESGNDCI